MPVLHAPFGESLRVGVIEGGVEAPARRLARDLVGMLRQRDLDAPAASPSAETGLAHRPTAERPLLASGRGRRQMTWCDRPDKKAK
jgi:hypothetical protein